MLTPMPCDANATVLQDPARVAHELHDSVSQTLYAITLTASRALRLLDQADARQLQQGIAERLQTRPDLDFSLSLHDKPDVPAETRVALVLITREALHNVVRHADAGRVGIDPTTVERQLDLPPTRTRIAECDEAGRKHRTKQS